MSKLNVERSHPTCIDLQGVLVFYFGIILLALPIGDLIEQRKSPKVEDLL